MTTARERALRLCDSHYHVRRSTGPCSYCTLIEREILAAEREAVEAFIDFLLTQDDELNAVLMFKRFKAWLRSRE